MTDAKVWLVTANSSATTSSYLILGEGPAYFETTLFYLGKVYMYTLFVYKYTVTSSTNTPSISVVCTTSNYLVITGRENQSYLLQVVKDVIMLTIVRLIGFRRHYFRL